VEDDNLDANAAGLPPEPVLYVQGTPLTSPANSCIEPSSWVSISGKKPTTNGATELVGFRQVRYR
jgi:hypothetical protein